MYRFKLHNFNVGFIWDIVIYHEHEPALILQHPPIYFS